MHGTYTHRITSNLYPDQYFQISHAARKFDMRVAPFARDVTLAYLEKRSLLPASLEKRLRGMIRKIRRVGTNLNQIAARANTYQRTTHDNLKKAGELVIQLERQVTILRSTLES